MKETIIGLLSSRRVLAGIGGFLASLLVPVLNKKLGLGLDPAEVAQTVTGIVVLVATYIVSRTAGKFAPPPAPPAPPAAPELPPEVKAALAALKK